jgi:type I restriction enzyme M protein
MPQQPSEFVVPLATMVYLRWADFQEVEALAGHDKIDYSPLLPIYLHWRCWHDLNTTELPGFFAERLPAAIQQLEDTVDPLAASLVRLLPAIRSIADLSANGISSLAGWLARQPFETPNNRRMLLEDFDAFLDLATSRDTGEFRTPACINDLLAALAAPQPGELLYDPCFGYAGNLSAACRRIFLDDGEVYPPNEIAALRVSGMDINAHSYAVGLARLVLLGVTAPHLEIGNSLDHDNTINPRKDGYDLIITDPPWGQRIEPRGMNHFPVQTNDGTSLYIQYAISQLRPDGRAVIVVPQEFLFQKGKTATVRRWLLENHRVDAVIGLPKGAFLPYTGVFASILIVHRDGGPTRAIRMVDGSAFFNPSLGKNKPASISNEQIEELASTTSGERVNARSWEVDAGLIAELGFDLTPTRREIPEFDKLIESLATFVPISYLHEICDIEPGLSIPSCNLSDKPVGKNSIPYLSIWHIDKWQRFEGNVWLNTIAASEIDLRHRLRMGDILISTMETIGQIDSVSNFGIGAIACDKIVVLRVTNKKVDPNYLAAILRSNLYQEWLKSKSSGSAIIGLQKRFIDSLPIPIPPMEIQRYITLFGNEKNTNAAQRLLLYLQQEKEDQHPFAEWADRSLSYLANIQNRYNTHFIPLQEIVEVLFGQDFWTPMNSIAYPLRKFDIFWVSNLRSFIETLSDLFKVPEGAAKFALLKHAEFQLQPIEKKIKGDNSTELKVKEIVHRLGALISNYREQLLSNISVTIELKTAALPPEVRGEIKLAIINKGSLPLHNLTIFCRELALQTPPYFLPECDILEVDIEVDAPKEIGQHELRFEWRANTLVGQSEKGAVKLMLQIQKEKKAALETNLGPSPYFVSEPVSQERTDIFVGREETIVRIKHQLVSGNTVLLEGNRRAGKSSILKQLEGLNRIQDRLAVYSSLQATEGDAEVAGMRSEAIWRTLAKSIISGVASLEIDVPLPDGTVLTKGAGVGIARACRRGICSEAPWEDFLEYITHIMNVLAQRGLGLVLMIDEFDKLQEGIDNKVTSPQIPENIRYLIQNLPGFSAILTGSRRMQRLRHEYWSALYGLGKQVAVTALEPDAARRLIQKPVEGRLSYTHEAVELLIELTACQPFLIQALCNQVFELAVEYQLRFITAATVNEAASRFVANNEHFASLMDYTATHRRRFIIMLVQQTSSGPDRVTFGILLSKLANEKIEIADEELTGDLLFLQDLELIDYVGNGGCHYALTVPLMGRWLDFQHDYHALLGNARSEQENQL